MVHLHFMLYWQVKQRIERSTQTKTLFQTSRYDVMGYQRIRDQAKHLFFFSSSFSDHSFSTYPKLSEKLTFLTRTWKKKKIFGEFCGLTKWMNSKAY